MAACQGVNNNGCCNLSKYNWSCEKGCYSVAGSAPWDTLVDCQAADHGDFVDALGNPFPYSYTANDESTVDIGGAPDMYNICGWQCSVSNTPCIPCFSDNCSLYPGDSYLICEQNCSALTQCYRCDCSQTQNCFSEAPCMTVEAGWDGVPTGFMGPDPTNSQGGGHTYSAMPECQLSCTCDAGWDCWINIAATQQNGFITSDNGCDYWANSADVISNGLQATAGGPYDSHSACCIATDCCLVRCDDSWPSWTDAQPIPYGDWPCMYVNPQASSAVDQYGNPLPQGTCSPVFDFFIPFCNMTQCHTAVVSAGVPGTGVGNNFCQDSISFDGMYDIDGNVVPGSGGAGDWCWECPGTGVTINETCECACGPGGNNLLPGTTHTDLGPWITSNPYYTIGDTVSYMDATNPLCCYICNQVSSATPTMEGNPPIPRQCGVHSPGDGPSFNAQDGTPIVNVWQSCGLMPSGTTDSSLIPTGCTACGLISQDQYSCVGTFEIDTAGVGLGGGYLGGCENRQDLGMAACTPPMHANSIEQIRLQTLANCFSDEDCYLKCRGGCFCEAGGNPYTAGTSECVTGQQYMVNEDATPGVYGSLGLSSINFLFNNLSDCNTATDNGWYDCCGNPRYTCLSGHSCSFSDPLTANDYIEQAIQLGEMHGTLDACVPLYPSDPGYDTAEYRDEWATATTLTLCGGAQVTFNASTFNTAAYNMCSWYCRWSCKNTLTPANYCHFVGSDPAEALATYHPAYNTQTFNPSLPPGPLQGCVTAPHYTSAMACWQAGSGPSAFSCWCNEDWVDCVVDTATTFIDDGVNPLDITYNSTCVCSAGTSGVYHTIDECENPTNYPNVPTSCCDGSAVAWCLAVGSSLIGSCDSLQSPGSPFTDEQFSMINTNIGLDGLYGESYMTDYTNNESGMPGTVLYEQYYANGAYVNAMDLSPNLMYSLQIQIAEIVRLGDQQVGNPDDDLRDTFESIGIVPMIGAECIEPNIPISLLDDTDYNDHYGWGSGGINNANDAYLNCCVDVNGTQYIKSRVRTISHEYLIHANDNLGNGIAGTVPVDTTYLGFDYSNLNDLIKAAEYIGVTGLTQGNVDPGYNFCEFCYHGTDDFYLTDIYEISYQISKQYSERIHPDINGTIPPGCIQGEQYLPLATFSSSTYLSCVTLKTKGCCQQPCFCTEDGSPFTWGTEYISGVDPTLSTGTAMGMQAPFVMNMQSYSIADQAAGYYGQWISGQGGEAEAFAEGYYSNYTCTSDSLSCCGQNTGGLVYGCTDQFAFNYDCKAATYPTGVPCGDGVNIDDGSCIYVTATNPYAPNPGECVWGCMDDSATGSNCDTEGISCIYDATNYNPIATCFSACTYI